MDILTAIQQTPGILQVNEEECPPEYGEHTRLFSLCCQSGDCRVMGYLALPETMAEALPPSCSTGAATGNSALCIPGCCAGWPSEARQAADGGVLRGGLGFGKADVRLTAAQRKLHFVIGGSSLRRRSRLRQKIRRLWRAFPA